jgi:hypothetical protein
MDFMYNPYIFNALQVTYVPLCRKANTSTMEMIRP